MKTLLAILFFCLASQAVLAGKMVRRTAMKESGDVVIYYVDEDYPFHAGDDDDFIVIPDYPTDGGPPGFPSILPPGPPPEEAATAPPPPSPMENIVFDAPPPPVPQVMPDELPPPPAIPAAPQADAPAPPAGEGNYGAAVTPEPAPPPPGYPRRSASKRTLGQKTVTLRRVAHGKCRDQASGCRYWSSFLRGQRDPRNARRRLSQDYCEESKADMYRYCAASCGVCPGSRNRRLARRRALLRRRVHRRQ